MTHGRHRGGMGRGFTLVELLAVVVIIGLIASLLLPAVARSRSASRRIQCLSQLRQLGLAGQMYWDDHDGRCFPYRGVSTNGGDVYWFGWLERGREGERRFDPGPGALQEYLHTARIAVCPSLAYSMRDFKLKACGAAYGYGYNIHLAGGGSGQPIPVRVTGLEAPGGTVFLADAAQVNTFQFPASPSNPMLEEFYYVSSRETTAHFRHEGRLNAVFCDGRVDTEAPVVGSIDPRLPRHRVGRLPAEILAVPGR